MVENNNKSSMDKLLESLQERAKELNCLYQIEEILQDYDASLDTICSRIVKVIPPGWQYPDVCQAKIELDGKTCATEGLIETPWVLSADILVQDQVLGTVSVYYTEERPQADQGPFLKEETKLIKTIADRIGHRIMHQKMRQFVSEFETARNGDAQQSAHDWRPILRMLSQTDPDLYRNISRKMLNHLCWSGVEEAVKLMKSMSTYRETGDEEATDDWNRPNQKRALEFATDFSGAAFEIAQENLSDDEILSLIQNWIQEDKLSFLVQVVNRNLSVSDVADAIRRYHHLVPQEPKVMTPSRRGVQVSLIRRFLADQLNYINVAKNYVRVRDFYDLLENLIYTSGSHGKLGGKSAGLYLAKQILRRKGEESELLAGIKVPRTWYMTSDVLLHFMHYNNFDEVVEQKYKEINQVRLEYPHIVQAFKNGRFPDDILKGLSVTLDDFGDSPIIVRSSSLLEDRMGAAFSGKYKSLFLANRGSKRKKLEALTDAIAEVYASTFGPDPIEYRTERGLLDFGEEMGIMVQEVVGSKIGRYFLPSFAGVAFSRNEFRWSPRIQREDGLLRLVPGLGTRAVDRLGDDYPVLLAPGQPNLRVNTSVDEVIKYAPGYVDAIDLDTNQFKTLPIAEFLHEVGYQVPGINNLVSRYEDGRLTRPMGMNIDFDQDDLIVTFDGLVSRTPFVKQMQAMLQTLEQTLGTPVDIEFASDGHDFYLLQCRPQSYSGQDRPAPIPKDVPKDQIVFSARKFVSNGYVPDITHIVYVDPRKYGDLADRSSMLEVGRAVSRLNKLLPKRQFVLMGPGRWGSRGDIKLGVSVTYSDINNSAVLIEIARQRGNYTPDLSFGTHFFQDLVEANIRYLPLYPDEDGNAFNELFLTRSESVLSQVIPEFAHLSDVVRLIDVPTATDGLVLKILMNADLDEGLGMLGPPSTTVAVPEAVAEPTLQRQRDTYWRWRIEMVERIAALLDGEKYGVAGFYVFGSTKQATAGPASDIDILIHFRGAPEQKKQLHLWLQGWSQALAEVNYMRTGYQSDGLLDIHFVTDEDIQKKSSYAAKIGAPTDAARPLATMSSV